MINSDGVLISISEIEVLDTFLGSSRFDKYLKRGWKFTCFDHNGDLIMQREIELPENIIKIIYLIKRYINNGDTNTLIDLVEKLVSLDNIFDKYNNKFFKSLNTLIDQAKLVKLCNYKNQNTEVDTFNVIIQHHLLGYIKDNE